MSWRNHFSGRKERVACRLWVRITAPSGVVYRVKSKGPRTEPWGMPHTVGSAVEKQLFIFTVLSLPVRYNENHVKGVPNGR